MDEEQIKEIILYYIEKRPLIEQFLAGVKTFLETDPSVSPFVHTIKSRIKALDHLEDKLIRKAKNGVTIEKNNLFEKITDLAGVRVLHLYPKVFDYIHDGIMRAVNENGLWTFHEQPVAYTWDPESQKHFNELGINTEVRDTYYTSIHYVIRPNNQIPNLPCCEIQVRTLFEEIWGEIDHSINYPHKTDSLACREQLRVLSKLVSTGTRLADAIYACFEEHKKLYR